MIKVADKIDKIVKRYNEALDSILVKAGKEIQGVVAGLEVKAGKILSTPENLKKIETMRAEIMGALDSAGYNQLTKEYIASYDAVIKDMQEYYNEIGLKKFVQADIDKIIALKDISLGQFEGLASNAVQTIRQQVSKVALSGGRFNDAVANIAKSLTGEFEAYSRTYAKTAITDFAATVNKIKSEESGIKKYRYDGHLQDNSRDCCREWMGNAYTSEEIAGFHAGMFADGSPFIDGDILIVRGGWNCNHYWAPVK